MALSPEEIADKEFAFGLRGYDQEEVRAFLHQVAAEIASVTPTTGSDGDRGGILVGSSGAADAEAARVLERASAEAADLRQAAEADAEIVRDRAQAVLAAAEAAALRLVAEAHARIDQRFGNGAGADPGAADGHLALGAGAGPNGGPTVDALGAEISALVHARDEILGQLQVVRSRVLAAVEAAEAEPVVRPLPTP